jgi:CRP-like cAMP-binding protein
MPTLKDLRATLDNNLLAALPREEYQRLAPHLELVHLPAGKILYHVGDEVRYAYFPKGGVLSLLSTTEDGRSIEVGMIGNEGMTGVPVILRSREAPYQVMVQLTGSALRIKGAALREEFNRGGRLQDLLLRYTHSLLNQVSQAVACNCFHTVPQRLCRWLLVSSDRAQTDTLHLTHEFLSHMLGVPRTSVTTIAGALQKEGLISHSRGRITILGRGGLEEAACECYGRAREGINTFLVA